MRISFERRCSKSAERRKIFIFIVTIVPHLGGGSYDNLCGCRLLRGGVAGDGEGGVKCRVRVRGAGRLRGPVLCRLLTRRWLTELSIISVLGLMTAVGYVVCSLSIRPTMQSTYRRGGDRLIHILHT